MSRRVIFTKQNIYSQYEKGSAPHEMTQPKIMTPEQAEEKFTHDENAIKRSQRQFIKKQLSAQKKVERLINPLSGKTITRFSATYWQMMEKVFGKDHPFYKEEKTKQKPKTKKTKKIK